MFKYDNSTLPDSISELFVPNTAIHTYNLRQCGRVCAFQRGCDVMLISRWQHVVSSLLAGNQLGQALCSMSP